MKQPKDFAEALKMIKRLKAEQVLIFILGMVIGAVLLMSYINYGGQL